MQDWRGRGRSAKYWATKTPKPAAVTRRPASFWRAGSSRRRSIWKIDGVDIRVPLLFIVPLAFLGGGILARDGASVTVSRGGSGIAVVEVAGSGQTIGVASVIDGDTIEIHGRRIRFDGIDAPESSQLCVRGNAKERCGQAAAFFLSDLIDRQTVRCETHDVDRYGRDIATCWLGDRNLNEAMVAAGQAVAYRRYSERYVGAEGEARAAGAGVWATEFEMPWDYRRSH